MSASRSDVTEIWLSVGQLTAWLMATCEVSALQCVHVWISRLDTASLVVSVLNSHKTGDNPGCKH